MSSACFVIALIAFFLSMQAKYALGCGRAMRSSPRYRSVPVGARALGWNLRWEHEEMCERDSRRSWEREDSPRAERSRQHPGLAEGVPQDRALLDEALGPAIGRRHRHHQPAPHRHRRQIIVQPQFGVGPIALVGFVADGEVEAVKAAVDGMADELVQVRAARPEAGKFAVVIAREHQIVAVPEAQAEIGRGGGGADVEPADMGQRADVEVGRDIEKKLPVARPRKDILDPHARERTRLLADQRVERALDVAAILHVDEADLAEFGQVLELAALALAGR